MGRPPGPGPTTAPAGSPLLHLSRERRPIAFLAAAAALARRRRRYDPSTGSFDAFVAKLGSASGAHLWSYQVGDASDQRGRAVAMDGPGDVFLTGFRARSARNT